MPRELLVIIDPQHDFINPAGHYAKKHAGINQILSAKENILRLLKVHDMANVVVVYSDYKKNQFEEGLSICIPGTEGHKIDLELEDEIPLISKNKHSCFSSNDFKKYLETNQVNHIKIAGFLAEYCVKQTAIDALTHGYKISLLKDCIGTGDDVQYRREEIFFELVGNGAALIKDAFNKYPD